MIAEHHPAVHEVLDCGTVGIPGKYSLSDYMKLARLLRQRHFDLAFVLDRSPMLTLLPWLANIPRRVGPDSLGRGFSLTDRVPVSTSRTQLQHQADIYLDLARALHLPIDHPHMRFVPTQAERAGVQSLADSVKTPHLARVAVFPGGGSNPGMQLTAKRWSLDGYREIVRRLVEDLHMQVLLIGGKEDLELNESLLAPLTDPIWADSGLSRVLRTLHWQRQQPHASSGRSRHTSHCHLRANQPTGVWSLPTQRSRHRTS